MQIHVTPSKAVSHSQGEGSIPHNPVHPNCSSILFYVTDVHSTTFRPCTTIRLQTIWNDDVLRWKIRLFVWLVSWFVRWFLSCWLSN